MPATYNPFEKPEVVASYEKWYTGKGRRADYLEKKLLKKLLAGFPQARSALDIGCGTGHFTRWFAAQGLEVTGLDISVAMLAEARIWNGLTYVAGDALQLPFSDRAFDMAVSITTLEFVADPLRALTEAVRVAELLFPGRLRAQKRRRVGGAAQTRKHLGQALTRPATRPRVSSHHDGPATRQPTIPRGCRSFVGLTFSRIAQLR